MNKKIAIFGHRKIDKEDEKYLESKLNVILEDIIKMGYLSFLFGSNSEFNDLCYTIITNLQNKYTNIERIGYLCAREIGFTLEESYRYKNYIERAKSKNYNIKIYEDINQFDFDNKNLYIERNKSMINDADMCIFYYTEKNLVKNNKGQTTNSGTKIALEYAKSTNKEIIIINKI